MSYQDSNYSSGGDYQEKRGGYNGGRYQRRERNLEIPSEPPYAAFVGNLPFDVTDDELYDFFAQKCQVSSVRIPNGPEGRPKGFAYVHFETPESLAKALEAHDCSFGNRYLRVSVADLRRNERRDDPKPSRAETASNWRSGERKKLENRNYNRDYKRPTQRRQREPIPAPTEIPTSPPFIAFVGNLSYDLDLEKIQEFFESKELKVTNVRPAIGKNNKFRGFAYVTFDTAEDLSNALKLHQEIIEDRPVRINISYPVQERRQEQGHESKVEATASPARPVDSEIVEFLKALDLEDLAETFARERINMKALRLLCEDDLKDLNLPIGARKVLLKEIESLQDKS